MATNAETREKRAAAAIVAAALLVIGAGTTWERARPTSQATGGTTVVARVPARAKDPAAVEREELRAGLRGTPGDRAAAVRLARLDLATARERADPRYLGRAEGELGPWWNLADPPDDVRLLRATIRQSRHEFEPALADLDRLVALTPEAPQAWLTRASVLTVRARYAEALASCDALADRAPPFVRAACRAPALGVTGHLTEAAEALAAVVGQARSLAEATWARAVLADLARWSGDARGAEALLRATLALAPNDGQTRAALADLLLDEGRGAEIAALVAGREEDDGLLLRKALAAVNATPPSRNDAVRAMTARFAASRLRGDRVHLREEARFALATERDPARALALARENWKVQREPDDARVLLEAALAAGDAQAAAPALAWLDETHMEWSRLRTLAAKVRGRV
jgi:hypothetical protein